MNKCFLIGRLVRDPELTTTTNGNDVCKFTLAINRQFKDANGNQQADYIPIVAWRTTATNCGKYLEKGRQCAVVGNIQTRSYDKDGEKRYVTEVIAESVQFLDNSRTQNSQSQSQQQTTPHSPSIDDLTPMEDDDCHLPF